MSVIDGEEQRILAGNSIHQIYERVLNLRSCDFGGK
jgi:hypothetical protein